MNDSLLPPLACPVGAGILDWILSGLGTAQIIFAISLESHDDPSKALEMSHLLDGKMQSSSTAGTYMYFGPLPERWKTGDM